MVELVARVLISARQPSPGHLKQSFNRQRRLVGEAEDYCEHQADRPLRIGELCREIGVSERTLRDAFYKVTNASPLAYLKTEKLNRVYCALRDAHPIEMLIKQAAYANGFIHLGQFSRDYKQLFGELPSQTLQRY